MLDNNEIYGSNDSFGYDDFEVRRQKVRTNRTIVIILGLVLFYVSFLYVGYSNTTYKIDEYGNKQALVVNIEARQGQEDYKKLKTYYNALYSLFQEAYTMEEQIQSGAYDSFTYATKYNDILTKIDSYMAAISVLSIDDKYGDMRTNINASYNYFAIYCQKVSNALNNDSYEEYMEAETWLTTAEDSFWDLSKTFVDFGHTVQIYNDNDLKWYEDRAAIENTGEEEQAEDTGESLIEIQGDDTNWKESGLRNGSEVLTDSTQTLEEPVLEENTNNDLIEQILNQNSEQNEENGYGSPITNSNTNNDTTQTTQEPINNTQNSQEIKQNEDETKTTSSTDENSTGGRMQMN